MKTHSIEIGKSYCFETVTLYMTGLVTAITETDVAITDAAWIASTGRKAAFYADVNAASEVEPLPDGAIYYVAIPSLVGFFEITSLPRKQK